MGNTNINIPDFLKEKAQKENLNLSQITQEAIKRKLGERTIQIPEKCFKCSRELEKQSTNNPIGLVWLDNAQDWICHICMRNLTLSSVVQ